MRFVRTVIAIIFSTILSGCGAGGVLNLNPQPDGNIVLTNATTGATLQTSLAQPFIITGGAFSIGLTEDHFSGPYTVSVTAWTAPFNLSCFIPHYVDQTNKTNTVKFSADNASPITAPTQPSPCNPFTGPNGAATTDEETATITDGKGHKLLFYYQIAGAAPASGGGGSVTPATLAVSWSGPSPSGNACGAYVLNVGAVDASGRAVTTTSANPITLSTTGGAYMGFSVASSASAGFTCPQSSGTPPVGSPGGTGTLQLTATPAQVLVYYNGFSSAPTTTITVSSVGAAPAVLTITNAQSTVVASMKLSWAGQAPTRANCGAFVLNVEADDASGRAIISSQYSNPITVSTNSAIWSGFSTVVAGISPAPPPAALDCGSLAAAPPVLPTVGTPTLAIPDTATPTVVYYSGAFSSGLTTITASAVGAVPATITF